MSRQIALKVVVLGDSGVGKTCLMNKFVTNRFQDQYRATVGSDFLYKNIEIGGRNVNMQIWDTAGQERFQALGPSFYRGSDCCILVFDVTVASSFQNLEQWKQEFLINVAPSNLDEFPFVVIGNKIDLEDEREITKQEALTWCKSNNCTYFEASARDGTAVETAFSFVGRMGSERLDSVAMLPFGEDQDAFPRKKQQDDCDC